MNNGHQNHDTNNYLNVNPQDYLKSRCKNAEIQRKVLVQTMDSCNSLDNASACELLNHKLKKYTETIYKDGENIYNNILKQTFPSVTTARQFKLPKTTTKPDLNPYLTNLSCGSVEKVFCQKSEKISQAELKQFGNSFTNKNEKLKDVSVLSSKMESRFENLAKLTNRFEKMETHPDIDQKQPQLSNKEIALNAFKTAREKLDIHSSTKASNKIAASDEGMNGGQKRKLGMRRTARSKFVSPLLSKSDSMEEADQKSEDVQPVDERLKNIEPKMVELIMAEIMDQGLNTNWSDIAGLEFAKAAIQEAVVWPMLRPDIFTGLRRPPKGILLFGPPGTGKTLIGRCVASQSKSTFFSISASSLTSKWIGDSEKMVRALFAVARVHQPSVIFIDEVDSLLTQRNETEHESTRRIKTEFLVQLDGAAVSNEERLLVIGATNRPQELDEAARRRFVKRLYIPLPEFQGRYELFKKLISNEKHFLEEQDFKRVAQLSEGYSGADIKNLCSEASLEPIRSIDFSAIEKIQASEVRPLTMEDFEKSFDRVKPSVSQNDLVQYVQWNTMYGSGSK